jgi:hypothetical protein
MSALPPKADIVGRNGDVRFVPEADICSAAKRSLFDHLVGAAKERCSTFVPERVKIALNA